jgi:hypothetical protein
VAVEVNNKCDTEQFSRVLSPMTGLALLLLFICFCLVLATDIVVLLSVKLRRVKNLTTQSCWFRFACLIGIFDLLDLYKNALTVTSSLMTDHPRWSVMSAIFLLFVLTVNSNLTIKCKVTVNS